MGTLRIIDAGAEPGFEPTRAWIGEVNGHAVPRALVGGVECDIETKPGLLDDGLAWCAPVDVEAHPDWPLSVRVEKQRTDGSTYEETLENVSADPFLVRAARRFLELAAEGEPEIGKEL
jgi:hypothetical protein